jgi:hypothetical protein
MITQAPFTQLGVAFAALQSLVQLPQLDTSASEVSHVSGVRSQSA